MEAMNDQIYNSEFFLPRLLLFSPSSSTQSKPTIPVLYTFLHDSRTCSNVLFIISVRHSQLGIYPCTNLSGNRSSFTSWSSVSYFIMCKVTLIEKKGVKHVVVELCAKAQLIKGGRICEDAKKKRNEYKAKYKEAVEESRNA